MEERVMVPARRAAAIADVSPQRLWYLEKTALVAPSIRRDLSHGTYDSPLRELKFAIQGREVFFQHPDGSWEGSREPHKLVAKQILDLTAIRAHRPKLDPRAG